MQSNKFEKTEYLIKDSDVNPISVFYVKNKSEFEEIYERRYEDGDETLFIENLCVFNGEGWYVVQCSWALFWHTKDYSFIPVKTEIERTKKEYEKLKKQLEDAEELIEALERYVPDATD